MPLQPDFGIILFASFDVYAGKQKYFKCNRIKGILWSTGSYMWALRWVAEENIPKLFPLKALPE